MNHNQKSRRVPRWFIVTAAVVALAGLGGAYYYLYQDQPTAAGNTPRARTLSIRAFLPAQGRIPRPPSVDPQQFTDPEVRRSYQLARNVPELLEQMPCYCGCYQTSGHTSNYDCFVDNHGAT